MASPACCSGIVGNSDLVGIGTRINLYITILLSAIIIPPKDAQGRPKEGPTTDLLDDLFANSIFYGLAVLITALVQTIQKQLDLYHAIFVSQVLICLVILHLYGVALAPLGNCYIVLTRDGKTGAKRYITRRDSPDSEPSSKFKWNITIAFQVLQVLIFVPWVLYIWVKDSRFGSQPECNHFVKYVFFFATVRATVSWLRILVFISLALCAVALVFVLVMALKLQQYLNDLFQRGSPERRTGFFGAISNALDSVSNVLDRVSRRLGGVSGAIVGVYARMAGASSAVIGAIGSLFPDPNGRREQYLNRLKARWWRRLDIAGKVF
ncbi:hypothetical protein EDB87DRAFT_1573690 [Lactarius vividus]|nr:hypothetical protein EDB87DRAFT_1573690 [Lactarius vividus]